MLGTSCWEATSFLRWEAVVNWRKTGTRERRVEDLKACENLLAVLGLTAIVIVRSVALLIAIKYQSY